AQKLFVVLDARLPARLTEISDAPEGSHSNPLAPDRELVGEIRSAAGNVKVFVDRVKRGSSEPIWLFSSASLESIPGLYDEVTALKNDEGLSRFLPTTRFGGVRLAEWLTLLLGVPLLYMAIGLLNRVLVLVMGPVLRRAFGDSGSTTRNVLPVPA